MHSVMLLYIATSWVEKKFNLWYKLGWFCKDCHICDQICQKGFICVIINIKKSCFEILNTVYLENARCLVYEILHRSIVILGNSFGVLFDGLLAELPAILDGFFPSTTSDYIGVVGRGLYCIRNLRQIFMDTIVK